MMQKIISSAVLAFSLGTGVQAEDLGTLIEGDLRSGWRLASGEHVAALHLTLAPGWKTYWRAPGDAGIPPLFNWSGSTNANRVTVNWPTPKVFDQSGMRSIGYSKEVVLPIYIAPNSAGDIELNGEMQLGLCKDICLPHTIHFKGTLPGSEKRADPVIASALAALPYDSNEASVKSVKCQIAPAQGGLSLRAEISMPSTGGHEVAVIETSNPMVWVEEPETRRSGRILTAQATMMHMEGDAFALDRSKVRFTVIGKRYAVDIQGCD